MAELRRTIGRKTRLAVEHVARTEEVENYTKYLPKS
jgi:hypothetical protein